MRTLLTSALLLLTTNAYATSVTLNQGASLQLALDNVKYDTLYLETAVFDEDAVIRRPVAVLPAPTIVQTPTPALRSLTIDATGNGGGWYGEVRGLRVMGPTVVTTAGSATQVISGCRLDRGLKSATKDFPDPGLLYVTYCTIFGDVDLSVDRVDLVMTTVIGGGVKLYGGSLGLSRVAGSHVQDAPAIAIEVRDDPRDAIIEYSTVTRAAHGLWLWRGGRATDNLVIDVQGDGMVAAIAPQAATTVEGNRFERCGRGIVNIGGTASLVSGNVVLSSVGDGIVAPGSLDVVGNTVALSGGVGVTAGGIVSRNLVAFNSGTGVAATGTCNLIWSNGVDARSPGNIYADPLFCDLGAGDLRVSAASPALTATCGTIGALGAGCPARDQLVEAQDGDPDAGLAPFGVQQRGRVALVTLAGPEPASLEMLDVAGRRISRENLVKSGEIALAQPAGVYFMRLTQGARSSSSKAVVLR